tara:strand:- start:849 stop:1262 length:414 start_codon:yes stop_codon:yes gene_type:complete
MRITESRLRKIIRSVLQESDIVLPPSQTYKAEGEETIKTWLKTKKGQYWWEQVNTNNGKEVRGIEILITNQDLEKNNILFRDAKPVCLLTGNKLKPESVVVKIQPEGKYSTIGYVDKEHCKKFAFNFLGPIKEKNKF